MCPCWAWGGPKDFAIPGKSWNNAGTPGTNMKDGQTASEKYWKAAGHIRCRYDCYPQDDPARTNQGATASLFWRRRRNRLTTPTGSQ